MGIYSNGMQHNESSCTDMVAMLASPTTHVGQLQVAAPGLLVGGLEDAVTTLGLKRPYGSGSYDGPTVEDGPEMDGDEGGDELSPGSSQLEKKRRLTFDQVRSLERNFEMENKLEPERKMQLAKELGLRPRQVAVWFQNRRARWKTKQLERDYETLAAEYERLKADYEQILGEKKHLKAEVQRLSGASPASEHADDGHQANESPGAHRARASPTVDVSLTCSNKESESVSGNSSDVLDADSPRTTDSSSCPASTSISDHREQEDVIDHSPENSFPPESSFLGDPGMLQSLDIVSDPVKLGDGAEADSTRDDFNEFVDQSCNYLLLQLDEQSVLPWWDWP